MSATLISLAGYWLWVGAAVAAAFLFWGIDRIDEDAQGAYAFRPLLVPAILLIWPVILWRWYLYESGTERWQRRYTPPRKSHLVAAGLMCVWIVFILIAALSLRQVWPDHIAPVQLSGPEVTE